MIILQIIIIMTVVVRVKSDDEVGIVIMVRII